MTAVIRTIILYLLIIVGIRLMGKRQIGELEPSELVLSLIIADLAAVPMQDFGTPLIMGVIPILTLLCLSAILSVLTVKSIRFRALLCSRPSIVIQDGKIIVGEMRRNRFTIDELMEELRGQGYRPVSSEVCRAGDHRPHFRAALCRGPAVTNQAMGLKVQEKGLPTVVVSDGRVLSKNLRARNLSMGWLKGELAKRGVTDVRQVFLLTVDEKGNLYLTQKEGAS